MSNFSKNWQKNTDEGVSRKFGGLFRNPPPLKPQIDRGVREINMLVSRLDQTEAKIKARDESIFKHVVSATQKGDRAHATIYANELSEIRKVGQMVTGAKLALEQVVLRLTTLTDLGDIAATLAPTIAVVRSVGQGLGNLLPNAQGEINEISSLLSSTLVEAGSVGGISLNFEVANEEARRVLEEAEIVAEQRMTETFPEIPALVQREPEEEGLAI
ncbi:MAG: Snf7 family protein [Thaumarchaeota archaeon]|nr:Snf7 family protein [Nitrososphaerota archaeon]